ncbi:CAP domain-containing protein [Endozoicomonas sp. 2B-B]
MNKPFFHRSINPSIIALAFSTAMGFCHAAVVDPFPVDNSEELNRHLSSHNYQMPEKCNKNADQGSCWARSIMSLLSEQELSQLYRQSAEYLNYPDDQPINAAALHLYLESHSAIIPEAATPGVPINHLNTQLAILLKKRILTITPLADGTIAIQFFSGFEDGSYEIEENIISLSEEPETLFSALITADISLFLTPGVNDTPGHVQPIVFNLQPHQTPGAALAEDSLNAMINRPARTLEISAVSSGDIPPYFFSALQFGVRNVRHQPSWEEMEREIKEARKRKFAREKMKQDVEHYRNEAASEYRKGTMTRFCASCAKGAFKLGILGAASAVIYQKWETINPYSQDFWKEVIAPNLPMMARLDGTGVIGNSKDLPEELVGYVDTIPEKSREAWKYLTFKVDSYLRSRWSDSRWTHSHWYNEVLDQPTQGFANQVLTAVNAIRSKPQVCGNTVMRAVGRLRWNYSLEAAAFKHATDMANKDFMSHIGSDGSEINQRIEAQGYRWSAFAENVAIGAHNLDALLNGWMSSPGHCNNIMNPNVIEMGVSFVENPSGRFRIYWAQVFASPKY